MCTPSGSPRPASSLGCVAGRRPRRSTAMTRPRASRVDRRRGVTSPMRVSAREAPRGPGSRDDRRSSTRSTGDSTSWLDERLARGRSHSTGPATAGASSTARRSRCGEPAQDRHRPLALQPDKNAAQAAPLARRRRRSICFAATGERERRSPTSTVYRYFASEGFLPGYSFPRLPLSAFIPGAARAETARRVPAAAPLPRDLRVRAPQHRLPRGLPLRDQPVFLPVERGDENTLADRRGKQCSSCGYLHPVENGDPGLDLCEQCGAPLDPPITKLFRLQNVGTERRDRINSDEEDRVRQGFDIQTGVRFAELEATPRRELPTSSVERDRLGKLTYGGRPRSGGSTSAGSAARTRTCSASSSTPSGATGQQNDQPPVEDDHGDPMSQLQERVVPYVEDRRNALLFEPAERSRSTTRCRRSLAALKSAIQIDVRSRGHRARRRAAPDRRPRAPASLLRGRRGRRRRAAPARSTIPRRSPGRPRGLELCHFDPDSGADHGHAPGVARGLRGRLLRLPDELRQPARPPAPRPSCDQGHAACTRSPQQYGRGATTGFRADEQLETLHAACDSELEKKCLRCSEQHAA